MTTLNTSACTRPTLSLPLLSYTHKLLAFCEIGLRHGHQKKKVYVFVLVEGRELRKEKPIAKGRNTTKPSALHVTSF